MYYPIPFVLSGNSRNMAVVTTPRYLCSHMVRLKVGDNPGRWANLEEIWSDGAVLECEEDIRSGEPARISCEGAFFAGHVTAVERHEFGWKVEIRFLPATPWSIEQWRPEHALDPASLGGAP